MIKLLSLVGGLSIGVSGSAALLFNTKNIDNINTQIIKANEEQDINNYKLSFFLNATIINSLESNDGTSVESYKEASSVSSIETTFDYLMTTGAIDLEGSFRLTESSPKVNVSIQTVSVALSDFNTETNIITWKGKIESRTGHSGIEFSVTATPAGNAVETSEEQIFNFSLESNAYIKNENIENKISLGFNIDQLLFLNTDGETQISNTVRIVGATNASDSIIMEEHEAKTSTRSSNMSVEIPFEELKQNLTKIQIDGMFRLCMSLANYCIPWDSFTLFRDYDNETNNTVYLAGKIEYDYQKDLSNMQEVKYDFNLEITKASETVSNIVFNRTIETDNSNTNQPYTWTEVSYIYEKLIFWY